MQDKENIIKKILSSYPEVWKDKKRFRALLNDLLPDDKLRRNLIYLCTEENIPDDIEGRSKISDIEKSRLEKVLIKACGCGDNLASEIVGLWIDALIGKHHYDELCEIWLEDMELSEGLQWFFRERQIYTLGDLYNKSCDELYCKWNRKEYIDGLNKIAEQYKIPIGKKNLDKKGIDELGLTDGAVGLLKGIGINSFEQIKDLTLEEATYLKEFDGDFEEVIKLIKENGMDFRDSGIKSIPYLRTLIESYQNQEDNPGLSLQGLEEAIELGYRFKGGDYSMIGLAYINGLVDMPIDIDRGLKWLDEVYEEYFSGEIFFEDKVEEFSFCYAMGMGYYTVCNKKIDYREEYIGKTKMMWLKAISVIHGTEKDDINEEVLNDITTIAKIFCAAEELMPGLGDYNAAVAAHGIAFSYGNTDIINELLYAISMNEKNES